ncbi:DoxX family protein [Nocardioides mangrovi]|uniref:DoxX family protein n=1 Tax=Nocardioides mangrovi TaxID=2874580 RepID=A0ABS7U8H1_9ACTN|nr:DoxX family protein [Nocardioides mangrovi]MBZ5737152.1 DoxX family protein [Nocardioides mangrovi]
MEIAYWIVAVLLAVFYLYAGAMKVVRSQEQLQPMMGWAGTDLPMPAVRFIGVVEVLGALGLVLPPLTGIAVGLAMAAAIGLTVLQVLALRVHLRRGEQRESSMNAVLALLAALAAWFATAL